MKKIFTLCAAVLFAGMAFAASDDREVVSTFTFTGFDLRQIQIGKVWDYDAASALSQRITPLYENEPYHVAETMTNLYRKDSEGKYTAVKRQDKETLGAGVYRFNIQIRIDGEYGSKYCIPAKDQASTVQVMINGQKWITDYQYAAIEPNYSYFYAYSPDFELVDPNIAEFSLWQELWFTEAVDKGKMDGQEFAALGAFMTVTPVDPDGKMAIDANTALFGNSSDSASYNFRLKTGGKSTETKTFLRLHIPAAGQLRIAARTGTNADTTRSMIITQGDNVLYNAIVQEADTVNEGGKRFYPYIYVNVKQGELILSSPVGGINIYEIAFRGAAEYGTDFNFPFGDFMMGSIGFTIDAYPEEYVGGDITDGLLLMIERLDVFGDFNTHDLYDPREIITSYIFKDGQPYKIIAAEGTINSLSDELISLYGKFLCNDLKIYNVQALIQVKSEGVKNVQGDKVQSTKVIRNGQLLIERNGRTYNANGIEVK